MPLLTLGRECLHQRLRILVSVCLGALVSLALTDDSVTSLAPGHVSGLWRRVLLLRPADRLGVYQVGGAIETSNPAPEACADLLDTGPGHPGRGRLLVLVGDARQLPLGVLLLQLGIINELENPVTTLANNTWKLQSVVVAVMMSFYKNESSVGDIPQLSFASAHTAHLRPILGTFGHGAGVHWSGPSGGGKI